MVLKLSDGDTNIIRNEMSHDKILYERLREERNEIAKKEGVKPYMVFQNKVLAQISEKKPATREELAQVKVMGAKARRKKSKRRRGKKFIAWPSFWRRLTNFWFPKERLSRVRSVR